MELCAYFISQLYNIMTISSLAPHPVVHVVVGVGTSPLEMDIILGRYKEVVWHKIVRH